MKIAYWVFCASKHNRRIQISTFGEIHTIRFSNFNRIRIQILFGFGKSCKYEYEYIQFWKIIRIRIRIVFGLKISAEYEYEYHYSVLTIRILFEYRIIRSPLGNNNNDFIADINELYECQFFIDKSWYDLLHWVNVIILTGLPQSQWSSLFENRAKTIDHLKAFQSSLQWLCGCLRTTDNLRGGCELWGAGLGC